MINVHNMLERTDHTAFCGRHAGKAGKDAHPARTEATILTFVLPHTPQEAPRQTKRLWEPG